jgi:tripartite-type tricarboxylate transporter receptor subunit TctC
LYHSLFFVDKSLLARNSLNNASCCCVGIPFEGDPRQIAALLGGYISIITPHFSAVKSLSGAKKVEVLAVLNENRPDFLPDIPTIRELGYKVPQASFTALCAPKGTPDEVVKKLYEVVDKVRRGQMPSLQKKGW